MISFKSILFSCFRCLSTLVSNSFGWSELFLWKEHFRKQKNSNLLIFALLIVIGLPPHLAQKMLRASQIFRTFDLNHSGSLDYFEWRNAMNALGTLLPFHFHLFDISPISFFLEVNWIFWIVFILGYYMNDFDAARLFAMIDRDHSGRISGKSFCFVSLWTVMFRSLVVSVSCVVSSPATNLESVHLFVKDERTWSFCVFCTAFFVVFIDLIVEREFAEYWLIYGYWTVQKNTQLPPLILFSCFVVFQDFSCFQLPSFYVRTFLSLVTCTLLSLSSMSLSFVCTVLCFVVFSSHHFSLFLSEREFCEYWLVYGF